MIEKLFEVKFLHLLPELSGQIATGSFKKHSGFFLQHSQVNVIRFSFGNDIPAGNKSLLRDFFRVWAVAWHLHLGPA